MTQFEKLYLTIGETGGIKPESLPIYNGPDQNFAVDVIKILETTLDDKYPEIKSVTDYEHFILQIWESGKCVQEYSQSNKLEGWVELYNYSNGLKKENLRPEAGVQHPPSPSDFVDTMNDIYETINKIYDEYLVTEYPTPDGKLFNSSYYGLDEDMLYLTPIGKANKVREKLERERQQAKDQVLTTRPSKHRRQMLENYKRFKDQLDAAALWDGPPKHTKKED